MSTTKQIESYLFTGKHLTKLMCINKFNYINLGDVIYLMRKRGIDVKTKMVETVSGKKYAKYYLENI